MLKSLRSKKPIAIALIGIMTVTTAALAAIKVAPKAITDTVTIHADKDAGDVILSRQDGSVAYSRRCGEFPCQIDISSLEKGEYSVMIKSDGDVEHMVGLYKE